MQEHHSTQETRVPVSSNGNSSVYDVGVKELHHVTGDESATRRIDNEFREARGRETARLHVTLKALSEADRRGGENTRMTLGAIERLTGELQEKSEQLQHLIETFEQGSGTRFTEVGETLSQLREQISTLQQSAWNQAETNFNNLQTQAQTQFESLSTQARESTERITYDVRTARDELVSLVDSRMNQSDASFAALRGDIEVVKFLVMDLIKDRIGRHDTKNKPF